MPDIEFVGDWDPAAIERATSSLRKSLGMGEAQGAEDTLQTTVAGLSPRQQKLLHILKKAGSRPPEDGDPCGDEPLEWDAYSLNKAAWVGQQRVTTSGSVLRFNANRRWERVQEGSSSPSTPVSRSALSAIRFPETDGHYGMGVYLPVVDAPGDGLRLRVRLAVDPQSVIPSERFEQMAANYAQDLELVLDGHGVKGIAHSEHDRITLIVVRDPRDLHILGSVGGSGVPQGKLAFRVVEVQESESGILLDIELTGQEQPLGKALGTSRRASFPSRSGLDGSRLLPAVKPVDRVLVRDALTWLRQRGGSLHGLPLKCLPGIPDFAPLSVVVAVPGDEVVYLCPGDLSLGMQRWVHDLAARLSRAEAVGALPADEALGILARAAGLAPHEWLAHRLLSVAAAVALRPSDTYLQILSSRGLSYWGNEATVAACVGEDYRTRITGAGIPNLVTLEWDCACPEYARMGQQVVGTMMPHSPPRPHELPALPE